MKIFTPFDVKMSVEDIEVFDWGTNGNETGESVYNKSIESYWLKPNGWYDRIRDLTFETEFYEEIPNELPFDKCMVRWENKSPKDSDYWGPVSTKDEVQRLFDTSLRCKMSSVKGKYYYFRPWIKTYEEYRCFWNGTLKCVSGNEQDILTTDNIKPIYNFLKSIVFRIPYFRCIVDICRVIENGNFVFKIIEFNSWETNSGGYHLNWNDNTDMIYEDNSVVYFVNKNSCITLPQYEDFNRIQSPPRIENGLTINPNEIISGDYLIIDDHLYIHNDIWMCKLTFNLKPIQWKRGIFRFTNLELINGRIISDIKYDKDFREISRNQVAIRTKDKLKYPRYGIRIHNKDQYYDIILNAYCELCIINLGNTVRCFN